MKHLSKNLEEFNQILFDAWEDQICRILSDLEIEEDRFEGIAAYWIWLPDEAKMISFHEGVLSKTCLLDVIKILEADAEAMIPIIQEEFLNKEE